MSPIIQTTTEMKTSANLRSELSGSRIRFLFFHCVFWNLKKKRENLVLLQKCRLSRPIQSFFDRLDHLDAFSIARLLKNTLVLLFFGETHYLLSLRASLGRELTQSDFSSAQIGPIMMQKSDPPYSGNVKPGKILCGYTVVVHRGWGTGGARGRGRR